MLRPRLQLAIIQLVTFEIRKMMAAVSLVTQWRKWPILANINLWVELDFVQYNKTGEWLNGVIIANRRLIT